jgi:hypothetical protein
VATPQPHAFYLDGFPDSRGDIFVAGQSAGIPSSPYVCDGVTLKYSSSGVPLWTNRYHGPGTGSDHNHALAVDVGGNVIVTGESSGLSTRADLATIEYSSVGVPLWTNRYEGVYDDAVNALAADRSGNVFVTGYRTDACTLRFDCLTVAFSSGGIPLWSDIYNGAGDNDDSGNAIATDGSGNVFVTGYSRGTNGLADPLAIKYSTTPVMPPLGSQRALGIGAAWLPWPGPFAGDSSPRRPWWAGRTGRHWGLGMTPYASYCP